jgi:hypothetical protein
MIETLTLKEASARYRIKVTALRRRIRDGLLVAYRPGKGFITTPADVEAMIKLCRVQPDRTSTLTGPETPSASGMALDQSELDAVLETRLAPKRGSPNTSPASIGRRQRQALGSGT